MNKVLIMVLAVCLVSVHAFVKRDAPAPAVKDSNVLEKLGQNIEDWGKGAGDAIKKVLDPETIKKNINDALAGLNKALDGMKPKTDAPKN